MSIKSKITGLVMAVVMTIGMTAGVSAQSSSSIPGSVELLPGVCSGGFFLTTGADFGDWKWTGGGYQLVGANGVNNQVTLRLIVNAASYQGSCDVNVGGITLTNGSYTIGHSYFSVNTHPSASRWVPMEPTGTTFEDVEGGLFTVFARLRSVPDKLIEGTYTGDITVTISNGQ